MGKRGPAPKPTAQKKLEGNPGKRPLNASEPQHPRADGHLPPPAWLDEAAQEKWVELVPHLDRVGLLTVVDGDALAAYCQAWAELKVATEELQRDGRTLCTDKGYQYPHPAVAMQRSAMMVIRQFSALFGLDPSSRSRLHVEPEQEQDEFVKFLSSKNQHGKAKEKT